MWLESFKYLMDDLGGQKSDTVCLETPSGLRVKLTDSRVYRDNLKEQIIIKVS